MTDTYSLLREFADSWFLLAMFAFLVGTWFWAFRPGSREIHKDAADVPFREGAEHCPNACPDCSCKKARDFLPEDAR